MIRHFKTLALITAILGLTFLQGLSPQSARAQTGAAQVNRDNTVNNAARKKSKETTLSFEDELVEGANTKPELFYLFQKKKFNYKRLIKLRENFLPEMRKTSEEIQRSRSRN